MAPESRKDELSLQELETLLLAKRRRVSEGRVRRYAAAERARRAFAPTPEESAAPLPLRAPETWVGQGGQDRYFRSTALLPLGAVEPQWWWWSPNEGRLAPAWEPRERRPVVTTIIMRDAVSARRRWRDALLFAVEMIALVGFLAVMAISYGRLQALNRETREALRAVPTPAFASRVALPTAVVSMEATPEAAATPSLTPTVALLPGAPRLAELGPLPPHLSGLVTAAVPLARPPTPGPGAPKRIIIAKIGVDAPVVAGDSYEDLKKGVGHRSGTANPGTVGNMVVSAHNDAYGELFRDLSKLAPGDEVLIYTDDGAYRYVVSIVEIVEPTRVEVMNPTTYPALTMITCYPYLVDTHRVVAVAELAN
jgi:sortase A